MKPSFQKELVHPSCRNLKGFSVSHALFPAVAAVGGRQTVF